MRAIEIRDRFGLDRLALVERPMPEPGPGQALVQITAVSLNYRDLLTIRGEYNPRQPLPLVPCSDAAGVVAAVGASVQRVTVGQRVLPAFAQRWISGPPTREGLRSTLGGPLDGTLTEYVVLDAEGLVPAPEHLDDIGAATLPCAGVTAWSALVGLARLPPGSSVVIQGTGGVSTFALQLSALIGVRAIVVSTHADKLERARALGAWATIDAATTPGWGREAAALAGGGVDLVVEVGGAATFEQSLLAVRPGGQVSLIGNLSGHPAAPLVRAIMQQVRIQGVLVGPRDALEALVRAAAVHGLEPIVDRVFEFEAFAAAFEHLASGRHVGKVCLRVA